MEDLLKIKSAIKEYVTQILWWTTPCEMEEIETAFETIYAKHKTDVINAESAHAMAIELLQELGQLPEHM